MQEAVTAGLMNGLVYRDRIRALTNVQSTHNVEYADIKSCDVVAIARKNDVVCIQIFFIRSGQNWQEIRRIFRLRWRMPAMRKF